MKETKKASLADLKKSMLVDYIYSSIKSDQVWLDYYLLTYLESGIDKDTFKSVLMAELCETLPKFVEDLLHNSYFRLEVTLKEAEEARANGIDPNSLIIKNNCDFGGFK